MRKSFFRAFCVFWLALLCNAQAWGYETLTREEISTLEKEKSKYSLFHPTPKKLMRVLETDRPDLTESPFTVDAGHFQYEADLGRYTVQPNSDGTVTQLWSVNTMNLKVGLTSRLDFQVIIPTYNILSVSGEPEPFSGYGDTFVRVKYNLFGDDGGDIAFAVMPYIKFPTAADGLGNKRTDGGIIFPFNLKLPDDWTSGLMFVYAKARNNWEEGYHSEFLTSWTLHHPFLQRWDGFIEIFSRSSNEEGAPWMATFDFGVLYLLSANVQLDTGANIGITPATDGISTFLGLSFRI